MTIEITAKDTLTPPRLSQLRRAGSIVTFPALPGLVAEGDTLEEARAMAADALRGYLENLAMDGIAPPVDRNTRQVARIKLALEDARSGRPGILHEAVEAWMNSWGTDYELPRPKAQRST